MNVAYGVSHLESSARLKGTSLLNYANADAIMEIAKLLVDEGFEPSDIKILTYYSAQRRHLCWRIATSEWDQSLKDNLEVSTVDSFRGRQAKVVLLDLVSAHDKYNDGSESQPYKWTPSFLRNPKRLCVGVNKVSSGKSSDKTRRSFA